MGPNYFDEALAKMVYGLGRYAAEALREDCESRFLRGFVPFHRGEWRMRSVLNEPQYRGAVAIQSWATPGQYWRIEEVGRRRRHWFNLGRPRRQLVMIRPAIYQYKADPNRKDFDCAVWEPRLTDKVRKEVLEFAKRYGATHINFIDAKGLALILVNQPV